LLRIPLQHAINRGADPIDVQPQQDYLDYKSQLNYLKLDYDRQQNYKRKCNYAKALQNQSRV
jgi:hypothetical protein